MSKYIHITRLALITQLQYKSFFVATLIRTFIQVLVSIFVWKTIFFTQSQVNGYTLETFTTYIIFANLLGNLNSFSIGRDLSIMIVDGNITGELLYPYSLITSLFFQDFAVKIVEIVKFIPILLVIPLLQGQLYLPNWQTGLLFLFSSLLGMFIILLLDLGFSLTAFFTANTWGVLILRNGLFSLASGALLPLNFYPENIANILKLLPYSFAVNFPVNILLKRQVNFELFWIQLAWIPILSAFIAFLWYQAKRRLVILGG
ncbi:ABC transporter permease [Streptococcus constellatus subsp. viborgensis]|uniref:ABC transporter permease n=1 Tax=Streptococcus constellatus TaxID=76860 RepID=UPI0018E178B6|nr:ABC-2 family transporter protein [Streptococcus constellatus]QQC23430.1 ABC-2 family transporter protein [Streptococcus constellatus]